MALATAVPASNSGMPAATRAPNTSSSRISVIGTEVTSARRKSLLTLVLIASLTLACPVSSIRRPGWRGPTAATACCAAGTAGAGLPATVNVTRA